MLSVDDSSFHITLGIARVKGEGLAADISLTTSLKYRQQSIFGWFLVNFHLTILGVPGCEVVKVVSVVESNLKQGMIVTVRRNNGQSSEESIESSKDWQTPSSKQVTSSVLLKSLQFLEHSWSASNLIFFSQ